MNKQEAIMRYYEMTPTMKTAVKRMVKWDENKTVQQNSIDQNLFPTQAWYLRNKFKLKAKSSHNK